MNDASFQVPSEPYIFGPGTTVAFNNSSVYAAMDFSGNATFNASSSVINAGDGGTNINVVGSGATPASLTLTNGTQMQLYSRIGVGDAYTTVYGVNSPAGVGIVNVNASALSVAIDVQLGATGGTGTLNVSNGGQVTSEDMVIGTGLAAIGGSGSNASASAAIVVASAGTFQISSGAKAAAALLNTSQGSTLAIGLDEGGISISGLATLAGSLDVTQGGAADPTLGETFDLLSFGSETGTFSQISLPPLDPGLGWSTANLYTNGSISVIAVPEPAAMGLLAPAALVALARRRRQTKALA